MLPAIDRSGTVGTRNMGMQTVAGKRWASPALYTPLRCSRNIPPNIQVWGWPFRASKTGISTGLFLIQQATIIRITSLCPVLHSWIPFSLKLGSGLGCNCKCLTPIKSNWSGTGLFIYYHHNKDIGKQQVKPVYGCSVWFLLIFLAVV